MDGYTVGEVARLARISVRTLHHYDGIGLLTPSARSPGGYRPYPETGAALIGRAPGPAGRECGSGVVL